MQRIAHKGRVADDISQFLLGAKGSPVGLQGIALTYIIIGAERQETDVLLHDALRLGQHLRLANPEGGGGNHGGEIVNLNAVKLIDAHLDRVIEFAHHAPPGEEGFEGAVFETTQGEVSFRKEVARPTGGVEKAQRGEFVLKVGEGAGTAVALRAGEDGVEFVGEGVEEERVDEAVDILHAGVVHAAGAAREGIERALEDRAEDGGRDAAPVEVEAGLLEEHRLDLGRERRNVHLLGKEAAVGVGEGGELGREVAAAQMLGRVERAEEFKEMRAEVVAVVVSQVVVELVAAEVAGIFGIEAKHKAHAEHVEGAERGGVVGAILHKQRVVDAADDFARLHRHLFLFVQVRLAGIDEETEAEELALEVFEQNLLRLLPGLLKVVDEEGGKVAHHDPARAHAERHVVGVALGLLVGREHRAVALGNALAEVFAEALLLDEDAGGGDVGVDETLVAEFHALLEANEIGGVVHAEDLREQLQPKLLALAALIAAAGPVGNEAAGGFALDFFC